MSSKVSIPELNPANIESLIERIAADNITTIDRDLIMRLLRLEIQLLRLLAAKNVSIAKLKRLVFGPKADKSNCPLSQQQSSSPNNEQQPLAVKTSGKLLTTMVMRLLPVIPLTK